MRLLFPLIALCMGCTQDPIDALESYATEICACEDSECIEQVRNAWEDENVERVATAELSDEEKSKGQPPSKKH